MHRWNNLLSQARDFWLFPAALLSLLTALSVPGEAGAQTPAHRVSQFLDGASGFLLLSEVREATLQPGDTLTVGATLLEGSDYMVVGYCDYACTNIDLVLMGESGQEVQADRLPDAEPILTVYQPLTKGKYTLEIAVKGA